MAVDDRLQRLARLAVEVGANVGAGQVVEIIAAPEHVDFVRALTRAAYERGASHVLARYSDPHLRRAKAELGPEEWLGWTPPWELARVDWMDDNEGATIAVAGDADAHVFDGVDPGRVAQARPLELARRSLASDQARRVNWTIVGYPNPGWATRVYGEPDVERLWRDVAHAVRLDEPDPVTAWEENVERLASRAARLTELHLDAVRFRGPGTDLTVGLSPRAVWLGGSEETVGGRRFVPNLPTEEVFTTPDRRRTEGTARATKPWAFPGIEVAGLELTFEEGRVVDVRAGESADLVRAQLEIDEGASMLGEVALVDSGSRVGQTGVLFRDGLFDENAACHIALGSAYHSGVAGGDTLDDDEREAIGFNRSAVHFDTMIGSDEVDVDGVTGDGEAIPILRGGRWILDD